MQTGVSPAYAVPGLSRVHNGKFAKSELEKDWSLSTVVDAADCVRLPIAYCAVAAAAATVS